MIVKGNSLFGKLGIGLSAIFLLFVFIGCEKEKSVTGPTASTPAEILVNNEAINAAGPSNSCGGYYSSGNPYPCCKNGGNCTWWAWKMAKGNWGVSLPSWGDAYQWLNNAGNSGYQTTTTPEVNSIAINTTAMATINGKRQKAGHVAWVISYDNFSVYVSEMICDDSNNPKVQGGSRNKSYSRSYFEKYILKPKPKILGKPKPYAVIKD